MYKYIIQGNIIAFELFYKNQKVNGIIDLGQRKIQKIQINSFIMNNNDLKPIEKIIFPEIMKYDDNDIGKKIYNIYIFIENYYINKINNPNYVKK